MAQDQIDSLRKLVSPSEVFEKNTSDYDSHVTTWSGSGTQHPALVLQPTSLESLSKVVKALYDSDLDFIVRGTGTGCKNAEDVVLSTQGFKDFHFDPDNEVVTLGSGYNWGEVDALMEEKAPGHQLIGSRCPWVGVAGSSLTGGISWLSHEHGLTSDPQNMLDVQIVLRDGTVVWAAEQPDLMWGLRGGGGNFGVITALKLRARRCTDKIFAGLLLFPHSALQDISKGAAKVHARPAQPKLAMHITLRGTHFGEPMPGADPGVGIIMVDVDGEQHARSEDGFAWAYEIEGCQEVAAFEGPLKAVNEMCNAFAAWQDDKKCCILCVLLPELDDESVVRMWKWWADSLKVFDKFGDGSLALLEYMQEGVRGSGGRTDMALPRDERRHILQLALGCKKEDVPANFEELVSKQLLKGARDITGPKHDVELDAAFLYDWTDLRSVYGENLERLREVKKKYDPANRFNKSFNLGS